MSRLRMLLAAAAVLLGAAAAFAQPGPWDAVAKTLGREGTLQGDVYKVGLPRSDLKVMVDGVEIKPALALGSWVAFKAMSSQAMVMGDLVVTEAEVNPVIERLQASGIDITAVHNHLLRATPNPIYVHISGQGAPEKLAAAVRNALEASKTPLTKSSTGPAETLDLDTAAIDSALGRKGKVSGGVYQMSIPRADRISDGGVEIPSSMGTAIAINFQPTGKGKVATTGDFVLTAEEVNPVLKVLGDNGVEVTAVHSHMLTDQPRLFFMHFWANGDTGTITKGLGAALNRVNVARQS